MCKYVDNSFHAMKVAFANEIGVIAKSQGVNNLIESKRKIQKCVEE